MIRFLMLIFFKIYVIKTRNFVASCVICDTNLINRKSNLIVKLFIIMDSASSKATQPQQIYNLLKVFFSSNLSLLFWYQICIHYVGGDLVLDYIYLKWICMRLIWNSLSIYLMLMWQQRKCLFFFSSSPPSSTLSACETQWI